ncbi:PAS domain S-box protein [bacterium]|nr:PAS domain S-box protein [bacterium]
MDSVTQESQFLSKSLKSFLDRLKDVPANGSASTRSNRSEEVFLKAFHSHPAIQLLVSSVNGAIVDANQAACSFYGYAHEEFVTRNLSDISTLNFTALREMFGQLEIEKTDKYALTQRVADGELRDVTAYTLDLNLYGRSLLWLTVVDVTEEARNRKIRALLLDISEAASVADDIHAFIGLVRDRLSDFLETTNFYVALYDESENIYNFPFYTDEEDPSPKPARLQGSITDYIRRTGRSLLVDVELEEQLTRMGEIHLIGSPSAVYLGVPLKTPHGIIGVLAVQHYHDPTAFKESDLDLLEFASGPIAVLIERLRAESALRDSEANFRTFIRESVQGIVFTDPNDLLLTVNREFQRIFGYNTEELIGRPNNLVVPKEFIDESEMLVIKARDQKVIKLDTVRLAKDGSNVEVSIMGVPIHRDGKHVGTYWVYRDLTDQRRSETLQTVLYEITKAATTQGDLNDVMTVVHKQLSKLIEASNFFVCLYDEETEEYYFPYFADEKEEIDPEQRFKLKNSMTDYVRRNKSTLLRTEAEIVELTARQAIRTYPPLPKSWLGVQLRRPDGVSGVVVVQSYHNDFAYDERDLELLEFVSSHISSVIEHKREQAALIASEERHRALFNQSPVGVLLYDFDFVITDCNQRHAEIMGAGSREELIGNDLSNIPRKDILTLMQRALNGINGYYEGPYVPQRREDELWISLSISPYYGGERQIIGGMAVVMDNSERRQAEQEAEVQRAYQEKLFEGAPEAIIILDTNLRVLRANPEFKRLFGYSSDEAEGLDLGMLILPEGKDDPQRQQFDVTRTGEMIRIEETQCKRRDGTLVHVSMLGTPIIIDNEVVGIYAIYRDITRRKQANDELAAEKERLAVTLASLGEGVITTDIDGRVAMINEQASKMTGWTPDLAIGQDFEIVFPLREEQTGVVIDSPVYRVIESGVHERWTRECILYTRDGGQVLIVGNATPVHNKLDEVIGAVVVFRDVTQQRKMEEEVAKIERLESIGVLAGGIAHDFNNILSAVLGNISIARMVQDNPEFIGQRLEDAEKATLRARELTQQLLTFSKGGQPIRKAADLADLIRESVDFTLRGSNVRGEIKIDADLWPSEIDESQINRVINNLVINANQAMPEGGNLNVRAINDVVTGDMVVPLDPGRYVRIDVEDNGPGMSEEVVGRIFDPFFTTKSKGSGLGLATSFSIIQKHDGLLTVKSEIGIGTTFSIYLPASDKTVEKTEVEREIPARGSGRVLVMDDEESVREVAVVMLGNLGFDALAVGDGEEALLAYQDAKESGMPFDVVIMDLTIPGGMGGEETIRKLREYDPDVRAIVSSGYSNDPVMAAHKDHGFCGVMAKPYLVNDLQRVLFDVLHPASMN